MASIRKLKKEIGEKVVNVIDECTIWEENNPKDDNTKSEEIIDDAITVFDELIAKVNAKKIDSKKKYFKAVKKELNSKTNSLLERASAL